MSGALKLVAAALILTVLYAALKAWLPAWAPLVGVAGAAAVLMLVPLAESSGLLAWLGTLEQETGTEAVQCLTKAVGVVLAADYSKNLCKDAGLASVGVCVEFCGRCLVLFAAWPLFSGVCQAIGQLAAG